MKLSDTHGGYAGKSLTEKIRDAVDSEYEKWMKLDEDSIEQLSLAQGEIEGLCRALAIITNTKVELHWDSAEARYQDRKRRNANGQTSD